MTLNYSRTSNNSNVKKKLDKYDVLLHKIKGIKNILAKE